MKELWNHILNTFKTIKKGPTTAADLRFLEVEALLTGMTEARQVPGLALGIARSENVEYLQGYGWASLEDNQPVGPQTVFRIASVSKPIAATVLAVMVAERQIDLDADIRNYVPEFPQKQAPVTLRQLAGHTAGIRSYRGKEYALNEPYTIEKSIDLFKDDPLLFDPGSGYHYTSFDWVLIALAMERVSGKPFHVLANEKVLCPLKMNSTFQEVPGSPVEHQAEFYTRSGSGFKKAMPVDTRFKLAGGGYLSTARDILKLGQAYLRNDFIPESITKEFLTSQKIDGNPTWYGLGWQVSLDASGRPYFGHIGNAVGGYSNFFVFPESDLVIVLLINCTDPKVQPLLDTAVDHIHEVLPI